MIVGAETSFSGRIGGCNHLIIDGVVEAKLDGCKHVIVNDGGIFKGEMITENADVRGGVEGALIVSKRLMIRATGRVSASIRYEEIEIEAGGKIFGSIQAYDPSAITPTSRNPTAKALRVNRGAHKSAKIVD